MSPIDRSTPPSAVETKISKCFQLVYFPAYYTPRLRILWIYHTHFEFMQIFFQYKQQTLHLSKMSPGPHLLSSSLLVLLVSMSPFPSVSSSAVLFMNCGKHVYELNGTTKMIFPPS